MLDSEEVEKDKTLVKAESGLNTTAHQQDLVTDTPSYFRLYNMLSTLNGVLSITLQQFYSVIKDMQYKYPYVAKDYGELENTTFITLDNEGKNMKKDLYQNKIES